LSKEVLKMATENKRVLLAYSGGLDTSCILKWLLEQGFEVYAYMADVGQLADFKAAEAKALKIGAQKVFIEDLKKEFVTEFINPCIQANAIYGNRYLLGTSMARPCIARRQVEIAAREGCAYVSHGCTGKGNDQVRFELTYYAIQPNIQVIAPWRQKEFLNRFRGRNDLLSYAQASGIPISATTSHPYSEDDNMFHISHESGILEDPAAAAPEGVYSWTKDPVHTALDKPSIVAISFQDGVPVKVVNHDDKVEHTDPVALFLYLNEIGGKHGIGRLDMVEDRFVGIKSRGIYETPAGTILREAHLDIEGITQDREVNRLLSYLSQQFSLLIYNGFWFSPEFRVLQVAIKEGQKGVTGTVQVQLYRGKAYTIARSAPKALYDPTIASFEEMDSFNPADSEGFIKINAVRLKAHANVYGNK
jgi:argininosuccinate synthase